MLLDPLFQNIVITRGIAGAPKQFQSPLQPAPSTTVGRVLAEPQCSLGTPAGDAQLVQRFFRKLTVGHIKQLARDIGQNNADGSTSVRFGTSAGTAHRSRSGYHGSPTFARHCTRLHRLWLACRGLVGPTALDATFVPMRLSCRTNPVRNEEMQLRDVQKLLR